MTYRVRNIVVAVVLAALAGTLTLAYVVNYKRHVQHGEDKVNVLVAARDIPAGTTGSEVVEQHMLKSLAIPRRTLVPGWVGNASQLQKQVAVEKIYEGEQVTVRRWAPPREQGVRSLIRGNERAAEFAGDAHQTLAGTLKAGDYVDVVGEWTLPDGDQHHVARVIIRNVLVLKAPDPPAEGAKLGPADANSAVQLRLTDVQSQKMNYIYFNPTADWYLQLRPPTKSTDSRNTYQEDRTMLSDGPGRRPR